VVAVELEVGGDNDALVDLLDPWVNRELLVIVVPAAEHDFHVVGFGDGVIFGPHLDAARLGEDGVSRESQVGFVRHKDEDALDGESVEAELHVLVLHHDPFGQDFHVIPFYGQSAGHQPTLLAHVPTGVVAPGPRKVLHFSVSDAPQVAVFSVASLCSQVNKVRPFHNCHSESFVELVVIDIGGSKIIPIGPNNSCFGEHRQSFGFHEPSPVSTEIDVLVLPDFDVLEYDVHILSC